ncbi:hypothetical protein ACFFJX_10405 [Pseudarcicella hirudinis]|uniref:hypothetical protein n=1 Tax=Pseudarcicella hirudinis TaxID=1079859 RepID=UPI0035EA9530
MKQIQVVNLSRKLLLTHTPEIDMIGDYNYDRILKRREQRQKRKFRKKVITGLLAIVLAVILIKLILGLFF